MAGILEKGEQPHLDLVPHSCGRKKKKRVRTKVLRDHMAMLASQRRKNLNQSPNSTSGTKLYCELIPGIFPAVTGKGPQCHLERQGVGLVPLPADPNKKVCELCGAPTGVAHVAFLCTGLSILRGKLLGTLNNACSELGVQHDHRWWSMSDIKKLRASFCPTRGTVPPPLERDFFSRASRAWKDFYSSAGATWQ